MFSVSRIEGLKYCRIQYQKCLNCAPLVRWITCLMKVLWKSCFSCIGYQLIRDLMVGLQICSCTTFASVSSCIDNTKSIVSNLPAGRDLGDAVHTVGLSQTGELNQQCDLMCHLLGTGKSWGFTSGWIKVPTLDLVESKIFLFNQLR